MDVKIMLQLAAFVVAASGMTAGLASYVFATKTEMARTEYKLTDKIIKHSTAVAHPVAENKISEQEKKLSKVESAVEKAARVGNINAHNIIRIGAALDVRGMIKVDGE